MEGVASHGWHVSQAIWLLDAQLVVRSILANQHILPTREHTGAVRFPTANLNLSTQPSSSHHPVHGLRGKRCTIVFWEISCSPRGTDTRIHYGGIRIFGRIFYCGGRRRRFFVLRWKICGAQFCQKTNERLLSITVTLHLQPSLRICFVKPTVG